MSRICITSVGEDLDSLLDPRFGRCADFIFVDPETMDFEVVQNEAATVLAGAGILAAKTVVSNSVEAVITGSVGPNALAALQESDISVFASGCVSVRDCIEKYRKGKLHCIKHPILNRGKGFNNCGIRGRREQ
jgi:predicted Fe-Mo cluster-binding NifX family protein